jgi:hypothetical protein
MEGVEGAPPCLELLVFIKAARYCCAGLGDAADETDEES